MFRQYKLRNYSFLLVAAVITISVIGIMVIGSAQQSSQIRQMAGLVIGVIAMLVLSLIDYTWILRFHWVMYIVGCGLLLAVLLIGEEVGGATRWIRIGIQFQPSDLMKLILILFFADFFARYENRINTVSVILSSLILAGIPLLLIYREPDLISEWDFWLPDYEPGYDNEYYWQTQNPKEIWENSRSWLDRYSSGDVSYPADPGLISTSSYYYGQFGLPNYRIVSSYVNPRLQEYLEQYRGTGKCFGSIRADHMSRDLAHVIYSCNIFE